MSQKTPKQILGARGERLAAEYLQNKGYTILEKNFSVHKIGEIDLIAQKGDEIVFIEVKTRTGNQYGYPEEAVDYWKAKKISRAARHFLYLRQLDNTYVRFDIISVHIDEKNNVHTIRHNENIPLALNY
ncbi:YraN family protein [Candidatus Uhrbacteria bacterium]|nr:YraN family protein [Candidatus Uhrbacteria bacterium]